MKIIVLILAILLLITNFSAQNFRDEFDKPELDPSWMLIRNPDNSHWNLTERQNFLRLKGSTVTLDDTEVPPVFIGRNQLNSDFEATTEVDFIPKNDNEVAGIVLRQNERQHYEFGIRKNGKGRELYLRYTVGSIRPVLQTQPIPDGLIKLKIRGFPKYYRFSYSVGNDEFTEIGGVETKYLEGTDGLRNVQVGLFASGNGIESKANADFADFDYNSSPKDPYGELITTDPNLPKGYGIFSVAGAEKSIIQKYPFIYRPSSKIPDDVEFQKGLVYAKYDSREMHVDLFRPKKKGKYPAVVIVHGGAWITGHYTMENPLAIALAQRGFVAVTVEYRLSNEKKYPAQIRDLKASVRWLRANAKKFGIDEKRFAAVGGSAGGHLVALLGVTNNKREFEGDGGNLNFSSSVQSVVDIDGTATFVDQGNIEREKTSLIAANTFLTGFTYAENPEIWKEASPITHVNPKSAPTLFLNSSAFRPFQQREEMAAKLNALGIASEIIVIPDTPHPFWLFRPWFDTTVDKIIKFFGKTMK